MEGKRYVLRPRYEGPTKHNWMGSSTYQVVIGGRVIGIHETQQGAAHQVLQLGGRIALEWGRMVIGGSAAPYDFEAKLGQIRVGRIMKSGGTSHSGPYWQWFLTAHLPNRMGSSRGTTEDKTTAAAALEMSFTELLARED